MKTYEAIEKANRDGRMGLIVYAIPDFPNPDEYRKIHRLIEGTEHVTVIEMTFPVAKSFSGHANSTIVDALTTASRFGTDPAQMLQRHRFAKASICVLYRDTADAHGFAATAKAMAGHIDGVLLEWDEKNHAPYAKDAAEAGVELIQCIGPSMSDAELADTLSYSRPNGLVYLMSAAMTGATLFSNEDIERLVRRARALRPGIQIAAGFGIRTAEHIEALKAIDGLDCVIVGTAFLEAQKQGANAVATYLDSLKGALSRA